MSQTPVQSTKNKLVKIYAIGLVIFTGIVGFITVFAGFVARLNLT